MGNRAPLTETEKKRIYQGKLQGQTLAQVAAEIPCSVACTRKWWRQGRDYGLVGLATRRRGRGRTGPLSRFARRVAELALAHKRAHPRWGANRVLGDLRHEADLTGLPLPGPSQLAVFFKVRCPECVATPRPHPPCPSRPPRATQVHELWLLDSQEGLRLRDGTIATICNVRDPVAGAIIASRAFAVQTAKHWRKLTEAEVQGVLRLGFTEWQTLVEAVQTDHELRLAGSPTDPFPRRITLWLAGLGVEHRFSRPGCPTDQAQVERGHRTLADFVLSEADLANLDCLQRALDRERQQYNHEFPVRASDCAGHPPLVVHPELRQPRRPYRPELEFVLFDPQWVYEYLAQLTFERKVSTTGRVSLGRRLYSVGRRWAGQSLSVRLDPYRQEWVFLAPAAVEQQEAEGARRRAKGLDFQTLTGLDPQQFQPPPPFQLPLPGFFA